MKTPDLIKSLLVILLIGITSWSVGAQDGQEQEKDTLALIDALFENRSIHTPGGALFIQKNGETRYNKAFGMANLEHGVPNAPETIFEAGSVSKQFTAAALLLLAVEDKLSLDDDIREYLPELPDYGETITIRHLLNHTSGLKDWGSVAAIGGWPRTSRVYNQDLARDYIFRQNGLNNIPGEEYIYSNSNYTLLTTIVERVTNCSLPEFTEARIFTPLGMSSTSWRDDFREIVPGRAVGYRGAGESFSINMPFENTYGHAALLTTTADLMLWNESWLAHRLGGKELSDLRVEQGRLLDGSQISYAAAVMIGEVNGYTEISHSGATAGYRAWLATYPEAGLSVAFLGNDAGVSPVRIGKRVAELFLGKEEESSPAYEARDLALELLIEKEGLFKDQNSHRLVELQVKDKGLYMGNSQLNAVSPDTLFRNHTTFVFNGDQLLVTTPSARETYNRVQPWTPDASDLEQYTGNYNSQEAAGELELKLKEGALYSQLLPSSGEALSPSFSDAFYAGRGKLYEFVRDDQGRVKGLNISVTRARNVYFEKR